WTTATRFVACGWVFASLGAPWVAQRVCPIPTCPSIGQAATRSARFTSLPSARRRSLVEPTSVAIPAESYPRYSSRLRPSTSFPATGSLPTIPMIPHMDYPRPQLLLEVLPLDDAPGAAALRVRLPAAHPGMTF